MKLTQDEILKLGARYALHLLYHECNRMGEFGHSADWCNLWDLLQGGLGNHDTAPQVPLDEIIAYAKKRLGE